MAKITPWVDITCSNCGCLAEGSGYYHRGIITELQNNTKDWHEEDGSTYCPECWAGLFAEEEPEYHSKAIDMWTAIQEEKRCITQI